MTPAGFVVIIELLGLTSLRLLSDDSGGSGLTPLIVYAGRVRRYWTSRTSVKTEFVVQWASQGEETKGSGQFKKRKERIS